MNARREAEERLGGAYAARVLEPSPPAVDAPPFFADDPVARGDVPGGHRVVSPVAGGDLRWADLAADDPDLAAWCADRWLAAFRRLDGPPPGLAVTRAALHRLAEQVVSPARARANGKIGLRFTRGGFGTPFFGNGHQVRVQGADLVVDGPEGERRAPITTLAAAAALLGPGLASTGGPGGGPGDCEGGGAGESDADRVAGGDEVLVVDPRAAAFIGDWFGFAASVLEELRAQAAPALDASRVQLWPEHFDLALELGSEDAGQRAAYGCSPGDEAHEEPYCYVAPWEAPPAGPLWNATSFRGAELPFAALRDAEDQRDAALTFFGERLDALTGAD